MSEQIIDSKVISSHNVYLTEKVEKLLQNKISWDVSLLLIFVYF